MSAQDLTLNIAVNLGRLSRWAVEGKETRIKQFLVDTERYVNQLEYSPKSQKFQPTFEEFKRQFQKMKSNVRLDEFWAEDALTWANILTHRAKLA